MHTYVCINVEREREKERNISSAHPASSAGSETRGQPSHRATLALQRHINGVVSKNNKCDNFGVGGIKRPF